MNQRGDHKSDDIALIGEYALHLLDADERRLVDQRLLNEPALRDLLREWDEGFISMADEIDAVAPPARLKSQIEAQLFADAKPVSMWSRLMGWNPIAIAVTAMLMIVAFVGVQQYMTPTPPAYVTQITSDAGQLVLSAQFDADEATIRFQLAGATADATHSHELWIIPVGETAPVSMGVLPVSQSGVLNVSQELRSKILGATMAVSVEPFGGSPTGAPTGEVLGHGTVVSL